MPAEAPPHGAPTRQYLNAKVTGVLLEGMKQLAKDQYVSAEDTAILWVTMRSSMVNMMI